MGRETELAKAVLEDQVFRGRQVSILKENLRTSDSHPVLSEPNTTDESLDIMRPQLRRSV